MTLQPGELGPGDAQAVREAGVSQAALDDAIAICFTFNVINRIADALDFDVPAGADLDRLAAMMLQRGYR